MGVDDDWLYDGTLPMLAFVERGDAPTRGLEAISPQFICTDYEDESIGSDIRCCGVLVLLGLLRWEVSIGGIEWPGSTANEGRAQDFENRAARDGINFAAAKMMGAPGSDASGVGDGNEELFRMAEVMEAAMVKQEKGGGGLR